MNKKAYLELRELFYDIPDWIRKKQLRGLGFFPALHYHFFIHWMTWRSYLLERRLQIVKRKLVTQEHAYVVLSCKILFKEKFKFINYGK